MLDGGGTRSFRDVIRARHVKPRGPRDRDAITEERKGGDEKTRASTRGERGDGKGSPMGPGERAARGGPGRDVGSWAEIRAGTREIERQGEKQEEARKEGRGMSSERSGRGYETKSD